MYNQDPKWLVFATYLSSDRVFYYHYNKHISSDCFPKYSLDCEFQQVSKAAQDYQLYFGGRSRKEDIRNNILCSGFFSYKKGSPDYLQHLAEFFLIWQGDCFEVRRELLETWIMLVSVIDPSWIIASAYSQLFNNKVLSEHELITALTKNQCPFAFPNENENLEYADNHVHFNGHGFSSLSMLSFVFNGKKLPGNLNWPYREEYTLFESGLLDKTDLPYFLSSYVFLILSSMEPCKDENSSNFNFENLKNFRIPSERQNSFFDNIENSNLLRSTHGRVLYAASRTESRGHQRWLLFCTGIFLANNNSLYSDCLSNLIRVSNILRNYMVVSAVGLGEFVDFFRFKGRKLDSKLFTNEVGSYDFSSGVSREYRVALDVVLNDKNNGIPHKKLMNFYLSHEEKIALKRTHLVIHFLRSIPDKNKPHDRRLQSYREKLLNQLKSLELFNSSVSAQETSINKEYEDSENVYDLRRLIRGYDVAGNENEIPIEVYSPILRVLRASKYPGGMPLSTRLRKPFLTIHSGEDYSHLLSGLRAIDEAVEFCKLREGDRLGHGLALGVSVVDWARRQRRAYLTAGQHLDNLVWAYHQAVQLSQLTAEHIPIINYLRDKIHQWSQYVYKKVCTPNMLYQAWLLRRNWPDYESKLPDIANFSEWAPDVKWLNSEDNEEVNDVVTLWQRYLDSGLEDDSPFNHMISVNCQPDIDENLFENSNCDDEKISRSEMLLYEAIQDLMMEKYSRLGLVVEACPTSNIYIGRMEKYSEHPIFRWNPPQPEWLKSGQKYNRYGIRSGPLAVCINTDDSALMPTTIANEHRIIRETAVQFYGVGTWMADLWIKAIMSKGIDVFRSNNL
ncbi:hypothetical protein ACVWWU_004102 [Pantoea sp. PA1]|uniref:antiviral RADAR system adenosine deaminase RdrB n=1 Tax=Pantoea ananas TaxID=553 RepID=UPI00244847F7|nr:antiviral RADAR system adenosine deaminase RdrB [Pantoea ananatis]MDH0054410.1 hypothetical protein [Pantoea ananatis]